MIKDYIYSSEQNYSIVEEILNVKSFDPSFYEELFNADFDERYYNLVISNLICCFKSKLEQYNDYIKEIMMESLFKLFKMNKESVFMSHALILFFKTIIKHNQQNFVVELIKKINCDDEESYKIGLLFLRSFLSLHRHEKDVAESYFDISLIQSLIIDRGDVFVLNHSLQCLYRVTMLPGINTENRQLFDNIVTIAFDLQKYYTDKYDMIFLKNNTNNQNVSILRSSYYKYLKLLTVVSQYIEGTFYENLFNYVVFVLSNTDDTNSVSYVFIVLGYLTQSLDILAYIFEKLDFFFDKMLILFELSDLKMDKIVEFEFTQDPFYSSIEKLLYRLIDMNTGGFIQFMVSYIMSQSNPERVFSIMKVGRMFSNYLFKRDENMLVNFIYTLMDPFLSSGELTASSFLMFLASIKDYIFPLDRITQIINLLDKESDLIKYFVFEFIGTQVYLYEKRGIDHVQFFGEGQTGKVIQNILSIHQNTDVCIDQTSLFQIIKFIGNDINQYAESLFNFFVHALSSAQSNVHIISVCCDQFLRCIKRTSHLENIRELFNIMVQNILRDGNTNLILNLVTLVYGIKNVECFMTPALSLIQFLFVKEGDESIYIYELSRLFAYLFWYTPAGEIAQMCVNNQPVIEIFTNLLECDYWPSTNEIFAVLLSKGFYRDIVHNIVEMMFSEIDDDSEIEFPYLTAVLVVTYFDVLERHQSFDPYVLLQQLVSSMSPMSIHGSVTLINKVGDINDKKELLVILKDKFDNYVQEMYSEDEDNVLPMFDTQLAVDEFNQLYNSFTNSQK